MIISGVTLANVGYVVDVKPAVVNLDAADYSAVPTNGSTIAGTGAYTINVVNPTPRISWNSANGGVFRVTTASTNNFLTFGPNYGSAQAFTVGMAY